MKQKETLEEAINRTREEYPFWFSQESFELGAKWQQENSNINALDFEIDSLKREIKVLKYQKEQNKNKYSEVEIIEILMEYDYSLVNEGKLNSVGNINKWFEQFKNK